MLFTLIADRFFTAMHEVMNKYPEVFKSGIIGLAMMITIINLLHYACQSK
jgi:hypothetical protein